MIFTCTMTLRYWCKDRIIMYYNMKFHVNMKVLHKYKDFMHRGYYESRVPQIYQIMICRKDKMKA